METLSFGFSTNLLIIATLAPSEDNVVAIPFPSPVPPPVINAVLPLNVPGGNIMSFLAARFGYLSSDQAVADP